MAQRLPEETPFYETIPMRTTAGGSLAKKNSTTESTFNRLAVKTKAESIGFAHFMLTVIGIVIAAFLGINAVSFTLFGRGIRMLSQPSQTVPINVKPVKVIPGR